MFVTAVLPQDGRTVEVAVAPEHPAPLTRLRPEPVWSLVQRIGFRFAFVYLVLYWLPFPFGALPWTEPVDEAYQSVWHAIVPWFGDHVLGLARPIRVVVNGSGDTTYHYVLALLTLILATGVTAVWSYLDRGRLSYRTLHEWLRIGLRLGLAWTMFSYGFAKVFPSQFRPPDFATLLQTYGDSSPMHLMWTFMGYSSGYTIFAGLAEVVGGALLLWRRTTLLGALLLVGVMGNVVVMNFCYDVPVKLYASHLWLMLVLLAAPDAARMWALFVLGRAVPAAAPPPVLAVGRWRAAGRVAFVVIALLATGKIVIESWERYQTRSAVDEVAVRGVYEVAEMIHDGVALPPLVGDATRWQRVWIRSRGIWIYWMDGRAEPFRATESIDGEISLDLSAWDDTTAARQGLLTMRTVDDRLVLEGDWLGKPVRVRLRKLDVSQSMLMSRGFQWIQEAPFNR